MAQGNAGGETRTLTGLPLLDFESSASTDSTTPALEGAQSYIIFTGLARRDQPEISPNYLINSRHNLPKYFANPI